MIGEGEEAPAFELPAVEGGEFREVALADYLGDDIVILAFYPADFNPSCSGETTDLDELDLFTMQKDVSIVGISADSVYSHQAFAEEYDLRIPLLADVDATVAAEYGVAVEEDVGHQVNRAVVVVDPDGEVQFAWQTEDLEELPPVETVREAVDSIGGGDTAEARYRVGHAHYVEGRRAFTSAMGEFEQMEWMMAQGDFTRAYEEFDEAADQFNTAVRFGEDDEALKYFERAEEKAEALWQAAEWLAEASSAYASGEGAEGEDMRSDAERPLETARDIHEPPSPDGFPPEEDPAEKDDDEQRSLLPTDDDGPDAALEVDIDGESEREEESDDTMAPADDAATADDTSPNEEASEADPDDEVDDEIDDEELEEIAAELEEQTKQAQAERDGEAGADEAADTPDEDSDEDTADADGEIELDLADPTEGKDVEPDDAAEESTDDEDESEDEFEDGDHGVPDSL